MEAYFRVEVTTLESSQSVQRRDLALFLSFMVQEVGSDDRAQWTPRLSQAFKVALQKQLGVFCPSPRKGDERHSYNLTGDP